MRIMEMAMRYPPVESQDDAALVWLQSAVAELLETRPSDAEAATGAIDPGLTGLLASMQEASPR
jgi:hypothetical protein